jgi:hypothetical protein
MDCVKRYIICHETNEYITGAVYVNNILYKTFQDKEKLYEYTCTRYNKHIDDFVYISVNDFYDKNLYLPNHNDFSYLMDYTEIKNGDQVYIYDEQNKNILYVTVKDISSRFRPKGMYDIYDWDIDTTMNDLRFEINKIFYDNHHVTTFTILEDNKTYIWEDYNYQQSFLSEKYYL